jgi:hypothetical protein
MSNIGTTTVTLANPADANVSLSKSSSSSSLADMDDRALPFTHSPLDSCRGGSVRKNSRPRVRDGAHYAKETTGFKKAGTT